MSSDRSERRAKAREMREARARVSGSGSNSSGSASLAIVAIAIITVGIAIFANRLGDAAAALPAGVTDAAGGCHRRRVSTVTVELWIDFQCPFCRAFEQNVGSTLEQLVGSGDAVLVYHPCRSWARSPNARPTRSAVRRSELAGEYTVRSRTSHRRERRVHQRGLVALGAEAASPERSSRACRGRDLCGLGCQRGGESERGRDRGDPTVFVDGEQLRPTS